MAKVELWCLMSNSDVLMTDSKENVLEYCETLFPEHTKELFEIGKSDNFTLTEYVLDTQKLANTIKNYTKNQNLNRNEKTSNLG